MINTNEVLKRYGLKPARTLGQNFLTDINIIRKIADAGDIGKSDLVLEIGPGIGALTIELSRRAGRVVAVEIDRRLIDPLTGILGECPNVRLINDDIMKVDLQELTNGWDGPLKVVSNLPYYITTPIVMRLLESSVPWDMLIFMVQKEVAQRMASPPGSKDYGALSVMIRYYSDPVLCFGVSRNCFVPKPDVDSAVVRLKRRGPGFLDDVDKETLIKTVRSAFGMRRKTLLNSLGGQAWFPGGKEGLRRILNRLDIPENIRAEALSIEQYAALSKEIAKEIP
jgi:16S rRNA (adenine1518-N6/adenine1519-N6)-dimethyltransferase